MIMNWVETALMNNPIRRALQRSYEAPLLARLGGRLSGGRALELGCGSGYGARLILNKFGAAHVDAIDLDPAMVERARRRLQPYGEQVRLAVGSVTDLRKAIGAEDGAYDAVFDFGIIHHVTDWRVVLAETARVLRPGGRFYFEEVTATLLARSAVRVMLDHPEHDRFTAGQFLAECRRHDLHVEERWVTRFGADFVIGVARYQP